MTNKAKKPHYQFAIENQYVTLQSIMQLLQGNERFFQFLLLKGYLEQASSGMLAFNFVGVLTIGEEVICCLPKYFENHKYQQKELVQNVALIIKVLKRIGYSDLIPDARHISPNDRVNSSEMVLADKILKDYIENGIFNKKKDLVSYNSNGETDWNQTVNLIDPIFQQGKPIYHDTFNSSVADEEFNLITELHKWSVNYFLTKYGQILDYAISFSADCIKDLSELGSQALINDALIRELRITYTDREIILLKRLLAVLNGNHFNGPDRFSIFGTGYFHVVWEKVCSDVFENKLDRFQEKIPFPIWKDFSTTMVQKDTLRPDIISLKGSEIFFVFDAKYYNLIYTGAPNLEVIGNPGIGDVGKQFLYGIAFKELPYNRKYNCFLFPKMINSFFEVVGCVEFTLFPDLRLYNVYISPSEAYQSYLNNSRKGQTILNDIAEKIDSLSA